ncbi:hypothetical protein [Bacillus sp. SD088]|uniref:hypothetical protein n=1 Tax=Bacillus sp. SD088 TaxID=2782012 RepID=UPI001A9758DB|nr:hypothetical protein [Bacillus sp. SD088]MBO0993231.1 hypothetical protein [Bacillus sp. SD088]
MLYGYFGKDINLTDSTYTYCRQLEEGSVIYEHTAMPVGAVWDQKSYKKAEVGHMPVYRVPAKSTRHHNAPAYHLLYNIKEDPSQQKPIHNPELERKYATTLHELLIRYETPACQFSRMGLSKQIEWQKRSEAFDRNELKDNKQITHKMGIKRHLPIL